MTSTFSCQHRLHRGCNRQSVLPAPLPQGPHDLLAALDGVILVRFELPLELPGREPAAMFAGA
jgi:hypothetical protein